MSIQTELSRIINAKAAIKAAIEGKGVTVPDATLLDGMAALIESIEVGGGNNLSTYVVTYTSAEGTASSVGYHEIGEAPPISNILFFAIQNNNTSKNNGRGLVCIGQAEELSGISGGLVTFYRYYSSTYAKTFFSETIEDAGAKVVIEDGVLKLYTETFNLLAGDTVTIIFGGYA